MKMNYILISAIKEAAINWTGNLIKVTYMIFLLCTTTAIFAGEKKVNSLEFLWASAEKNSPGLKARLKKIKSIQHSIEALPKLYMPDLFIDAGYSGALNKDENNHGLLTRAVLGWTIWDGGRNRFLEIAGRKNAEMEKWQQELLTIDLKVLIANLYYDIPGLNEKEKEIDKLIGKYKTLLTLLKPRLKIGKIGPSDMEDIRIRISECGNKTLHFQKLAILKKKQIRLMTGEMYKNISKTVSIFQIRPLIDGDGEKEIDFKNHPKYKMIQANIKSAEANLDYTRRDLYWPGVGLELYGGYGPHIDALDSKQPEVGASLKLRLPLLSSSDRGAQLTAKETEIESIKLDAEHYLKQAEIEYQLKIDSVRYTGERLKNLELIVKRAEKNLKAANKEFKRGLKTSADMIGIIQNLFNSRLKLIDLRSNWLSLISEIYLLNLHSK